MPIIQTKVFGKDLKITLFESTNSDGIRLPNITKIVISVKDRKTTLEVRGLSDGTLTPEHFERICSLQMECDGKIRYISPHQYLDYCETWEGDSLTNYMIVARGG